VPGAPECRGRRPSARDRIREKTFLRDLGLATAPFFAIRCEDDLAAAVRIYVYRPCSRPQPSVYDGKGQLPVDNLAQARSAFSQLGNHPCVLEEKVNLAQELSVVLARGMDGETAVYPVAKTFTARHSAHHARTGCITAGVAELAIGMAQRVAAELDYVGVLRWNSSSPPTANCSSMKSRHARTTADITRWTPVRVRSSSSKCARCVVCR